jgi:short-subunit dehydrogenase
MDIALADVDEAGMQPVAAEIAALGRRAVCIATDVRKAEAVQNLLDRTLAELGSCALLFNNAGVFHASPLIDTSAAQFQRMIDINLGGVIHGSRIFGNHFVRQREGHIVNTASAAGIFPVPGMSAYSLTKYGVVAFSLQLRWELSPHGVHVTVLCPGTVKTNIVFREGVGFRPDEARKLIEKAPGPEALARKALRAVRKNRPTVYYSADAYILRIMRLLPMWLIDPFGRFIAKTALTLVKDTTVARPSASSEEPALERPSAVSVAPPNPPLVP